MIEAVVALTAGPAVAWQFTASDLQRREKVTLRITAGSFLALVPPSRSSWYGP